MSNFIKSRRIFTDGVPLAGTPSFGELFISAAGGSTPAAPANGDWQFVISGNNLLTQRREGGVWVDKNELNP